MPDFRGYPACSCLVEWLPVYEAELQRRGVLTGPLRIYQLIGNAAASSSTHSTGGAFDITDLVGETDVWVARQMGADASWARTAAQGFTPHIHGVLTDCPHNGPARYQIDEVRRGENGLVGGAADDGPRPLSGRTWREGIAWAKELQEDPMTDYAAQLDAIQADGAQTLKELRAFRKAKAESDKKVRKALVNLHRQAKDDATKDDVLAIVALLDEAE